MEPAPNGELIGNKIQRQLGFLTQNDWQTTLATHTTEGKSELFSGNLVHAQDGIGYCMDERRTKDGSRPLKPAFVGGAAGWRTLFMATGMSFEEAGKATKELYAKNNWGEMEVHIDDEHGHVVDGVELDEREEGCGFLTVWHPVLGDLYTLLGQTNIVPGLKPNNKINQVDGKKFIADTRKDGGVVVPLVGNHKTIGSSESPADVVVNFRPGTTLNRNELYDENPAFLWDAWATTGTNVLEAFNTLAETNWTTDQFLRLQAALHLATGIRLNAVDLDTHKNIVLTK
ncbi:MAG: hypothetical protein NUV65_00505 [Candidatus Roizmanbacteria bacterium]|nr:hypothetical protein [Candidatus Roizmanbacteria bacterium]